MELKAPRNCQDFISNIKRLIKNIESDDKTSTDQQKIKVNQSHSIRVANRR